MRTQLALFIAVAILGTGCAKPEAQVVGKWHVDPASLSSNNSKDDALTKQFAQAISIEFKSDKTFSMTMLVAVEGTYTVTDRTVTMTPTKMAGVEMSKLPDKGTSDNKPIVCTLSEDGKFLSMGDSTKTMKFVKAS